MATFKYLLMKHRILSLLFAVLAIVAYTQPSATSGNVIYICGTNTTQLGVTVTGGAVPYTYQWSNGTLLNDATLANPTATVTASNYFRVTVTDANSATAWGDVYVEYNHSPATITFTTYNESCNGDTTGSIATTVTGACPPFQYLWSNGNFTANPSSLGADIYTVTVTDCNGCTTQASDTLIAPAPVTVSLTTTNATCYGGGGGSICANVTGGTPVYTYTWSNASTAACANNLMAGVYTITVTDANGCTATASATVGNGPEIISVLFNNQIDATCGASNGSVCATPSGGTGPYTFLWNNLNTAACNTNIPTGTYVVTITDINGCRGDSSFTINSINSTLLVDTLPIHDVSCFGGSDGSINITVSGGTPPYTYAWNNGITTQNVMGLPAGYYFVTVTDANGCVSYNGGYVNEPALIAITVFGSGTTCAGGSTGSISVNAAGGVAPYSYLWSNASTTQNQINLPMAIYYVTVVDANGCTVQAGDTIAEVPTLNIGFTNVINTTCGINNGSVCATVSSGSGNYTYIWSNTATTQCLANIAAGNYTVTVADNSACSGSATVTITDLGSTLAVDSIITDVTCYGGTNGAICLNIIGGTPPYTYVWNTSPPQNTQCVTQLSVGIYNVTVTDANGCSGTSNPYIWQPAPFIAFITNIGDGSLPDTLSATLSGGIPPYNYNWTFGQNTPEIVVSISGEYIVWVFDANGCQALDSILIGCTDTCVWPGDADYSGVADNNDLLAIGLGYGTTGTARVDQSITWSAHQSTNWTNYLGDTTNYKHIDCNGDGTINSDDTLAIIQNYYLQHPRSGGPDEVRGGIPTLRIRMVPDTLEDGQTVIAHLELGDANSTADNVYGLAFTFNFDPLVVDTNEVYIAFNNNSWLCNNTTDHIDIDKKDASAGKLYTALTRIDHSTRSGGGEIGSVSMKITTGNINGKDLAFYAMNTYITDLRVIDNQGNVLDVDAIGDASTVQYEPTGINEINWRGEVSLYPNPAQQQLTINSSQLPISNLQVNNLLGETVLEQQGNNSGKAVLNVADLADGVYILKIASGSSTYHTKFMVNK